MFIFHSSLCMLHFPGCSQDAVLAALAAAQSGDENLDDVGQRLQQWLGGVEDGDKDMVCL